jgi:hypothetical protein
MTAKVLDMLAEEEEEEEEVVEEEVVEEEVVVVEVEEEEVEVVVVGECPGAVEVGKLLTFFWQQPIALKRKPSNVGVDILRMGICSRKTRSKRMNPDLLKRNQIPHLHTSIPFIPLLVMFLWRKTRLWMTPCDDFLVRCCPLPRAACQCLVSLSPTKTMLPILMKC